MHRRDALRSVALLVSLLGGTPPVAAQASGPAETFAVVITGGDLDVLAGTKLTVLRHHDELNGLRPVPDLDAVFDDDGRCEVELTPGRYAFEVLDQPRPDTIVALRTKPRGLGRGRTIELAASEPVPLNVAVGGKALALETVTVRSAALEGALVWEAAAGTPSVIFSPDQRYRIGVLGRHDEKRYAFWLHVRPEEVTNLELPVARAFKAHVAWRPDSPLRDPEKPAHVAFFFPDCQWRFEIGDAAELVTNRRYVEMSYSYPTTQGGELRFYRQGYRLGRDTSLEIGGPLTDHAYVGVHRHYGNDGYDSRLASEFWIADPAGHLLSLGGSKVKVDRKLVRVDGQDLPPHPLPPGSLDALRPLSEHFRVEAAYDLDGPKRLSLRPAEAVEMRSEHFVLQGVPGWEWRSQMYLLRAERAYDVLGPVSAYPASSRVTVGWLTNDHRARGGWKGKRAGAKRGFINMPFRRYRECFDLFTHTNFLVHEVGHTYGYSHGDAMKAVQREGERRYREFRWYVADHPSYVPPRP